MSKLSSKHREELLRLLGNPPNLRNVPSEFWDKVKREEREKWIILLLGLFTIAFDEHAQTGARSWNDTLKKIRDGVFPQPKGTSLTDSVLRTRQNAAMNYASQTGIWLADKSTTTLQAELGEKITAWEQGIADGTIQAATDGKLTKSFLDKELKKILGRGRAETTAITEVTRANTWGGASGIQATVEISNEDVWITSGLQNVCRICRPLHGTLRPFWGQFFPMGSPAHQRCNCWIWYANWGPNKGQKPPL